MWKISGMKLNVKFLFFRWNKLIGTLELEMWQQFQICNLLLFKLILWIDILSVSYKIVISTMPQNTIDKSTLVQVMAWCHQAPSHHLSQNWPRSMLPYSGTRTQLVNLPCSPDRLWWLHRLPYRDRRGRRCPCLVPLGQASSSSQGTHIYMGAFTRHSVSTTEEPICHMSYNSPLIWFQLEISKVWHPASHIFPSNRYESFQDFSWFPDFLGHRKSWNWIKLGRGLTF